MADIESALSNESIKCPDADPCAALRADLKRRQLAAGDEAAERGIANAQGLRGFADSQCKVGVHAWRFADSCGQRKTYFSPLVGPRPCLTNVPKCP